MSDLREHYVLTPGATLDLDALDPADTTHVGDRQEASHRLKKDAKRIGALAQMLFADRRRALLIVLQGVDTSGKDGTIKAVFGRTSPKNVEVTSFARPTETELAHDFLWRVHAACPRRGAIGVFNRSHYEDVLAGQVRKLAPADVIERRYGQINAFEELLSPLTVILKFMLHISSAEQKRRLQARLDQPDKRWKFDPVDLDDRALRSEYLRAYETVFARCASPAAPWYVVPADHKWARDRIVASIVRHTLQGMDLRFPQPDFDPASITVK